MSVGGACSIVGCKRSSMYKADVCYICSKNKTLPRRPNRSSDERANTPEQIREAAKAGSEPLFRCDDYGQCEFDFFISGRCLHCGALGSPDELEFLTRRQARFELITFTINMDTSPAENHALHGIIDALEERDSAIIGEEGPKDSPAPRIERLSTTADMLEMSREHLDDTAYAALESGLREIDSRERPWEGAMQAEAAKGWWLPDDDIEAIRRTMPHSDHCYCGTCIPERMRDQAKRGASYGSLTKAELRALLKERDLPGAGDFEGETKNELIDLLLWDDSNNSLPMLIFTILGILVIVGALAAATPLVILVIALLIPSYVYEKLTGSGDMARSFKTMMNLGADPGALPEGWHDKPKEEGPSTYFSTFLAHWMDPYFMLGFITPFLYNLHQRDATSYTPPGDPLLHLLILWIISIPFYTDRSEAPLVRAGTGFHIAISAMGALALAVIALVTVAGILVILYLIYSGESLV